MLLERSKKEVNIGKNFNPLDLKTTGVNNKADEQKLNYKRIDSIIGVIMSLAVIVFFNFFPGIIDMYGLENPSPVLNLEFISSIVWIINVVVGLSIIGHLYKIVSPEKTILKAFGFYLFGLLCCITMTLVFTNSQYLSEGFLNWLRANKITTSSLTNTDLQQYAIMVIIGICVIVYTIEFIVNVGRVLMLRKKK
jgi:hypothetical protein